MLYTKSYLIRQLGYTYDRWMPIALEQINAIAAEEGELSDERVRDIITQLLDSPRFRKNTWRSAPSPFHINLERQASTDDADGHYLADNYQQVVTVMSHLMRLPTVEAGAVMPDACPAGTICVGGVVAARNAIHPAFHSADVCCSMSLTEFDTEDATAVLDTAMKVTHFGPTARPEPQPMPNELVALLDANPLTRSLMGSAVRDFATQGDGNHFLFVGTSRKTGKVCVVTHHGSRSLGAKLYKQGMATARSFAAHIAPDDVRDRRPLARGVNAGDMAWIPFDTPEGQQYWDALQIVRQWTYENHKRIHDLIQQALGLEVLDHFWNEHNFVFKRGDLFYHAKGATPGFEGYERTLVPMNMAEPVLVTRGTGAENGLGFLPHGAGRNMSRSEFQRRYPHPQLPQHVDIRSFSGTLDTSELPQAYKNAAEVKRQMIETYKLAEVIDEILPYGSIMAGEPEFDFRSRRKRRTPAALHIDSE
ncbi:RtcB family protein [Zymobacter sp. IVIA_5232.4 C2]|uniref:RtcB family protein n=1 Tax=Zymobacter sp. IVIA_5232.4 C2 TaxID=3394855 RepID=UPI0039C4300C